MLLYNLQSIYDYAKVSKNNHLIADNFMMGSVLLGALFSTAVCKLITANKLILIGISGGVYSFFGFHYDYPFEEPSFCLIFDVNNDYPFTLADLKYLAIFEGVIATLQFSKVIKNWPVGHSAHVLGYIFGMFLNKMYFAGVNNLFEEEIRIVKKEIQQITNITKNDVYDSQMADEKLYKYDCETKSKR